MNAKNSIIEYYRRMVCIPINKCTYKFKGTEAIAMDKWAKKMKEHVGDPATMTTIKHAENIFCIGEHLRDVFFSTKDNSIAETTSVAQSRYSSGGYLWERLVAYYLNYCLANTRTVVFVGATGFDVIKTAVTFNDMNSASEVDLLAITFPDRPEFKADLSVELHNMYPDKTNTPEELKWIHGHQVKKKKPGWID